MASLGQLTLRLAAETSDFQGDLGRAAFMADRAASKMINAFSRVGAGIVAGLGTGLVIGAVTQMGKAVIDTADQLQEMSDRTGIAVEELSAMAYAAKVSGTDIDSLEKALGLLSKKALDAATGNEALNRLFKSLGVEVKDANGKMLESTEIFRRVGIALGEIQDPTTRSAVALELMGRAGTQLIPLAMNFDRVQQEAKETGAVMSGEFADAANKFNDNMAKMSELLKASGRAMLEDVVPAINTFLERVVQAKKETDSFLTSLADAASITVLGWFEDTNKTAERLSKHLVEASKNLEDLKKRGLKPGDLRFEMAADQVALLERRLKLLQREGERAGGMRENVAQNGAAAAAQAASQAARTRDAAVQEAMAYEAKKKAAKEAADAAKKAADARQKEIDAVAALEQRLGTLRGETTVSQVSREIDKGRFKDFSAQGKAEILEAARALDEYAQSLEVAKAKEEQYAARQKDFERGQDVIEEFERRNREVIKSIDLQAELSMMSENERQVRAALADLDNRRLEALREIYKLENEAERVNAIEEVNRAYERQAKAIEETLRATQDMQNDLIVGLQRGLLQYSDSLKKNAQSAQDFVVRGFKAMEDAIVEFTTTGKLSFSDFARSVIEDLIRMQIRASITGPLSGFLSGLLSSFSPTGSVSVGGPTVTSFVGGTTTAFAGGGVMGPQGLVPLKKYASGGVANSPQMAMFGEGSKPEAYVPLPDGRSIPVTLNGGGGSTNVVVNVNVENGEQNVMGDQDGAALGRAISLVVQQELIKQKRNGGILAAA